MWASGNYTSNGLKTHLLKGGESFFSPSSQQAA